MSTFPSSWSRATLAAVLMIAPLAAQQLAVEDAMVSDLEGGFGAPITYEFSPGQKAYLSFVIRGFEAKQIADSRNRKAALTYEVEAVDCSGRLLAPPHTAEVDQLLGPRDGNWAPTVNFAIEIPAAPVAGTHNFRIRVADKNSGATTSMEIPFEVQSPYGDPADTLSVERFRFYRTETATDPVENPPLFRPSDVVWGRFFLSGFRTGPGNQYDLQYGVSIRNPAGRVLLNEPKAAAESKESFYPKGHVSGVISIILGRAIRPGSYFLVLSATDSIGKQQVQAEYPFRVSE